MADFVLVAGSFLGGWAWEKVTPHLELHGHRTFPVTLTGLGDRAHLLSPEIDVHTHAQDIVNAITYADLRDVVLVVHSYAGGPGTIAAARVPDRIAKIVYVAALNPEQSRPLWDVMSDFARDYFESLTDGWLMRLPGVEVVAEHFGEHGVERDEQRWLLDRATDHPITTFTTPILDDLTAAYALPNVFVKATDDPAIDRVRAGIPVIELESDHFPMASAPERLATVLRETA
ncbi:alpha/beta fold hydrolase [Pseudonocardiaceae bacterium YIM PH 21723]|nr:alpha/beta fold hydrolase [Pseudonocardiaceae bacterium YIM PH 21723]